MWVLGFYVNLQYLCLVYAELTDSGVKRAHHDVGPLVWDPLFQVWDILCNCRHGENERKKERKTKIKVLFACGLIVP